jgi:mono/diheme cytochrome c family protein
MPSFSLIAPEDIDALVDYVIYLSVRGETERRLLTGAVDEFDYGEGPPEESLRISQEEDSEGGQFVRQTLARVAEHWFAADQEGVDIPSEPVLSADEFQASIQRGKKLFHGAIANCVGCHGAEGTGQLPTLDYDDWTKDYTTRIGLTPTDRAAMEPFREVGALRPRPIRPRNLQDGVFRGGTGSNELFCRIVQGIAGTPMPAVAVVEQESGVGLTSSQIWDLVHYVQSLVP